MHGTAHPIEQDLVLIGGGHAHVAVLRSFGMNPVPGVRLTLITRTKDAAYTGMLPGYIAGHYGYEEVHIDLQPLCRFAKAQLYIDEVVGIDTDQKAVLCAKWPPVGFDTLSIDTGSTPAIDNIPGAETGAIPVKPVDVFLGKWDEVMDAFQRAEGGPFRIIIVGAGAGGIEVALSAHYRLNQLAAISGGSKNHLEVHVVSDSETVLSTHNERVQQKYRRILENRGIHHHHGCRAAAVESNNLRTASGERMPFEFLLWLTHATPPSWIRQSGLQTDDAGFIAVDATLQSVSHPDIFAAGDVAAVLPHPRPKSGVFAVRQGPPLDSNLRRFLKGHRMVAFKPQKRFLSLISTGDRYAVASKGPWALEGAWVWRWKTWIDRRWMRRYQELPQMGDNQEGKIPGGPHATDMRCGGCGSKVGSDILGRVLNRIETIDHADVILGLQGRDDAVAFRVPPGRSVVQTVDFFTSFIDDPFLFGQVAANHCLSDLYATNALPQSALAIATIPLGSDRAMEEQLFQVMSGATRTLTAHEVALLGGHTNEGDSLGFGLIINGLAAPEDLLRKGGMQADDVLVLTHPIGTGCLFAADMRAQARGSWIAEAIENMLSSRKEAARAFGAHGATACTDITGFGLLGHLVEMLAASEMDAKLNLGAIPVLSGALESIAKGIESSLAPQNRRFQRYAKAPANEGPRFSLLFDPQTSGGLLATVPRTQASACLKLLKSQGYRASTIIGEVTGKQGGEPAVTIE
jgi:selenide,water dikinase